MYQLTCEEKTLLNLINSYIHQKEFTLCENWDKVFLLAKRHSLGSLFFLAVKDIPNFPNEVLESAREHFAAQTAQQIYQEYYLDIILKSLSEKNIKHMPLKGKRIREFYPSPEARTSCDVDIFYEKQRTKDVNRILTDNGFKFGGKSVNHSHWQKKAITFEMHYELAAHKDKAFEYYGDVWDRLKTDDGVHYRFTDEDFYIYFMVHSSKHFFGGGFGIRTVLDIFVYRNSVNMDKAYLQAEFDKLGLSKFVSSMEKLADVWFGEAESDSNTEEIASYILQSSTYGISSNSAVMRVGGIKSKKKARITYFFKVLFPSYKIMKIKYPVLKYLPILLPFTWIYKWFEVLFTRKENFKKTVNNIKAMDDEKIAKIERVKAITGFNEY